VCSLRKYTNIITTCIIITTEFGEDVMKEFYFKSMLNLSEDEEEFESQDDPSFIPLNHLSSLPYHVPLLVYSNQILHSSIPPKNNNKY
jgi:hypothetical protein